MDTTNLVIHLAGKIKDKSAVVGIIGMGYVGKALADLTTEKGFNTIGFEIRQNRANVINKEGNKLLHATTDFAHLQQCDIILICVQTPVDGQKRPDLSYLQGAAKRVAQNLRKGQLIITESSIATGTTRDVVLPILRESKWSEGKDYFVGYSPERVDPGNTKFKLQDIPKIVSGMDENSLTLVALFYKQIMTTIVPVSSLETAELTKMFENTFRLINISLVNEMKEYAESRGIDMWEVIDAASTKPFGFLAHYPSPGVGGHCIPVDPYYIYEDAKKRGVNLTMIEEAGKINDKQPLKIVERAVELLNMKSQTLPQSLTIKEASHFPSTLGRIPLGYQLRKFLPMIGQKGGASRIASSDSKKKVLLIGLAYKPNIDDLRESPAIQIWDLLEKAGYAVSYHDPYIPVFKGKKSVKLTTAEIQKYDLSIIITNHSNIDYAKLASAKRPIIDTRNVYTNGYRNDYIYRV